MEVHKILAARGFEFGLITFDDVINCLSDLQEGLRFKGDGLFGITMSIFFRVLAITGVRDEFLVDLQEPSTGERLSLMVGADKYLKFVFTNTQRRMETYNIAVMSDLGEIGRWRHIQFSLGSKRDLCRVEIRQNGASILNQEMPREFYSRRGFDYTDNFIGGDFNRSKGGMFDCAFLRYFNYFLGLGEQMAEDEFGRQRFACLRFAEDKERFFRFNGAQWLGGAMPCRSGEVRQLEAYYDARSDQNVVR